MIHCVTEVGEWIHSQQYDRTVQEILSTYIIIFRLQPKEYISDDISRSVNIDCFLDFDLMPSFSNWFFKLKTFRSISYLRWPWFTQNQYIDTAEIGTDAVADFIWFTFKCVPSIAPITQECKWIHVMSLWITEWKTTKKTEFIRVLHTRGLFVFVSKAQ